MKKLVYDLIKKEKRITEKEIRIQTGISPGDLKEALIDLEIDGEIVRTKRGKLMLPELADCYRGLLEVKRAGFGFVLTPNGDVFVRRQDLHGALNGEEVLVRLNENSRGESQEGEIIRVLSKGPYLLTGIVRHDDEGPYVLPDDRTIGKVILNRNDPEAKDENIVIAEITKRSERSIHGAIREVLGIRGEKGVDILAIAKRFGMEQTFPEAVMEELAEIPQSVPKKELHGRQLLFDKKIITIDGESAKDLDDAISIEHTKSGNRVLGVHIADVSHYVRENSALDKEALKRGTSVYLLDRVIPMLPKELSNGICSLNENEIRLSLSCFMEFDENANLVSSRVEKTAIKSLHRMTYTAANAILDGDSETIAKYRDIMGELMDMNALALQIRAQRHAKGSVDFEIPEAEIELDEKGVPINISLRRRGSAEMLIEDFMVRANECVAELFSSVPFLYRIHEKPSYEKVQALGEFLANFGINVKDSLTGRDAQSILKRIKGTPSEAIINSVMLRSMQKARYSTENAWHFGLASDAYSHFTSPIRRYPDLQIHRIISEFLAGELDTRRQKHYSSILTSVANSTSESEIKATEAERKVDDIKKAQYMSRHTGDKFEGIVSGVTGSAIFVELPNTVEGVVPLSEIPDDYYEVIENLHCIVGRRTGRKISLGDPVRVVLNSADAETGRIEFSLLVRDRSYSRPRQEGAFHGKSSKSKDFIGESGRKHGGKKPADKKRGKGESKKSGKKHSSYAKPGSAYFQSGKKKAKGAVHK